MLRKCLLLLFLILVSVNKSSGHLNDFGVWGGITLNYKFTRNLSASVEEQFRFNQNAGHLAQYFSEAGASYSLSKKFKVGLYYRFSQVQRENYFSRRHRWFADVSFRQKSKSFQVLLRARMQQQVRDVHSSESGKIPDWYSRVKLTVKLDRNKKYLPYVSAELFYLLSSPGTTG